MIGLVVSIGLVCLLFGPGGLPSVVIEHGGGGGSDDGSDPVFSGVIHRDFDDMFEDQEHNPDVPKSIPVSISIPHHVFICDLPLAIPCRVFVFML